MAILKQKLSLLGESKYSYKNNRKKVEISVFHLGTGCCWHQLVQELITKLLVLKCIFILDKKLNFQGWKNTCVLTP